MNAVSFPNDSDISYRFLDWPEWGTMAYELAAKILSHEAPFDRLVALATGGLTLSRAMKDYLQIKRLSSLHINFYTNIGETAKTPIIRESIGSNIEGERILVFDDINDTGGSLRTACNYLQIRGAKQVVTATTFQKPVTTFPSDYFVEETSDWVIFPDEVRETIVALTAKWHAAKISDDEIQTRLKTIGFLDLHLDLIRKHP